MRETRARCNGFLTVPWVPDRYVPRHARPKRQKGTPIAVSALADVSLLALLGAGVPVLVGDTPPVTAEPTDSTLCLASSTGATQSSDPVSLWLAGSSWLGGDQGASVTVADGSTVWLFNDTLAGNSADPVLLRNSLLVTKDNCVTYSSLDAPEPTGEFFTAAPGTWWWPTHGVLGENPADIWVSAGAYTGSEGTWDFQHVGDALFKVDIAGPLPRVVEQVSAPEVLSSVTWSAGLARWQDRLLLYGVDQDQMLHVASTPMSSPGASWQFAGVGGGWVSSWSDSSPVAKLKATSVSFFERNGQWVGAVKPNGFMGDKVMALVGPTPLGPFTYTKWFDTPTLGSERWTYNPMVHSGLSPGSTATVSLSTNHESWDEALESPRLYRPMFMEVTLPALP